MVKINFYKLLESIINQDGESYTPYAAKQNGKWLEGTISIHYLNNKYGKYKTYEELIKNTAIKPHKMYFEWLHDKGLLK